MNKRTVILWACLTTLLFSAAKVSFVFEPTSPAWLRGTVTAEEPKRPLSDTTAHFDLLSAVYGPDDAEAPGTLQVPPNLDESTLWLARATFSETKLPHEQELVAWVVRNRVETNYRGKTTYREVVLDPYQFSAFNPGAPKRSFLLHLNPETELTAWRQALWIAHYVRHADPSYRPFSLNTRHFFSERSMQGHPFPYWADHQRSVSPSRNYTVNERRFRFYKEIS